MTTDFGMRMNRFTFAVGCLLLLSLAGCRKHDDPIVVQESEVYGLWQKAGTQEFWRYNSDHTGVTWDLADDISEEESNLAYTWSLEQSNKLRMVASGAQGNQFVPKSYSITEISSSSMKWDDGYGLSYTLNKVVE